MPVFKAAQKPAIAGARDEETASLAFRARLRSQSVTHDSSPTATPSRLILDGRKDAGVPKTISQFHAALKSFDDARDDQITRQLKIASANARGELHTSVVGSLQAAHDDIDAAITRSSEPGSNLLSSTAKLYANIEHPLSASLCHSATTPRATISAHCSNLQNELQSSSEALELLKSEWTRCLQREEGIWKRIEALKQTNLVVDRGISRSPELVALQEEVSSIVERTEQLIADAESKFCEAFKLETMKMLSKFM